MAAYVDNNPPSKGEYQTSSLLLCIFLYLHAIIFGIIKIILQDFGNTVMIPRIKTFILREQNVELIWWEQKSLYKDREEK